MGWRAWSAMAVAVVAAGMAASPVAGDVDGGSVWLLDDVVVVSNDERWAEANEHPSYHTEYSAGRSSFSVTPRYVGPDQPQYDPPMLQGEGITLTGRFSEPPARLVPDDEVSVTVGLTASNNTLSGLEFHADAWAEIYFLDAGGEWASAGPRLYGPDEAPWMSIRKDHGDYAPVSAELVAVVPAGREDRRLVVRQTFSGGVPMHTDFVYRWGGAQEAPAVVETAPTVRGPVCPVPPRAVPVVPPATVPPDREYSGVGFNDLFGGVYVIPGDYPDDYYSATLDSVLYVEDEVETRMRSGAILSLRDMTTFVMGENSLIRIGGQSEAENRWKLLFGHVWVNLCQIIEDGTMDIEMSQGVAGIKGTTLVVSDDGVTSSVKVFEGDVAFTSHATGASVMVSGGQMVDATAAGLGPVSAFDMDAELGLWDEQVQGWTREVLAGQDLAGEVPAGEDLAGEVPGSSDDGAGRWWVWALLAGAGALVVAAGTAARRRT